MKAYVMVSGDWSVGIPNLDIEIDLQFETEEENRNFIRQALIDCFEKIYDQKIGVEFEDERIDYINKTEEIFSQQGGF